MVNEYNNMNYMRKKLFFATAVLLGMTLSGCQEETIIIPPSPILR